jgi:hypothetical protein
MGSPILTTNSTLMCPHGGTVNLQTSNVDVKIQDAPALLVTDVPTVAGCPFTLPNGTPSPCVTVRWSVGATQNKVHGTAVLLQNSVGLCYSAAQVPQGPPTISQVQSVALGL